MGAALFFVFAASAARAEDQPFLTLDTTDIEPQLAHEFEQDLDWTIDPSAANGLQIETEIEYGLRDDLQLAGAIDYGWEQSGSGNSVFRFEDADGEAIYRLWNVDFDPLGLGILVSGALGPDVRDAEAKLLAQKNFLNDRLRLVINTGWIGDWQRNDEPSQTGWSSNGTIEWAAGLAYSVTWELSACLEFDNDRTFEGLPLGANGAPGTNTYFFGPTVQYVASPVTVSAGFQAQLPWASGAPDVVQNGFATDAERYRIGLRVTRSF